MSGALGFKYDLGGQVLHGIGLSQQMASPITAWGEKKFVDDPNAARAASIAANQYKDPYQYQRTSGLAGSNGGSTIPVQALYDPARAANAGASVDQPLAPNNASNSLLGN